MTTLVFSVEPSAKPERVLGAVDVDPERDHTQVLTEVHAIDHQCDQIAADGLARPDGKRNLSKAFDYLVSGSVDCGADDEAASNELNKAIDYLNIAAVQIKSLGG